MTPRSGWLAVALLGCLAPVTAQGPLAEVRVSVEAVNQPLRAVLAELARQTGVEITVDPRVVDGPVVLQLTDQPLDRALNLLTRGAGLVWTPRGQGAYVTIDSNARVSVAGLGELPAVG
ncbi:MAG: hypothetical protein HUU35_19755, partial [Armatimonadetes bacterium]|nr:hypothetical protein [Armatimonadota bacterium]